MTFSSSLSSVAAPAVDTNMLNSFENLLLEVQAMLNSPVSGDEMDFHWTSGAAAPVKVQKNSMRAELGPVNSRPFTPVGSIPSARDMAYAARREAAARQKEAWEVEAAARREEIARREALMYTPQAMAARSSMLLMEQLRESGRKLMADSRAAMQQGDEGRAAFLKGEANRRFKIAEALDGMRLRIVEGARPRSEKPVVNPEMVARAEEIKTGVVAPVTVPVPAAPKKTKVRAEEVRAAKEREEAARLARHHARELARRERQPKPVSHTVAKVRFATVVDSREEKVARRAREVYEHFAEMAMEHFEGVRGESPDDSGEVPFYVAPQDEPLLWVDGEADTCISRAPEYVGRAA